MLHALTYMEHTSFAMQITVVVPDSMHFSQVPMGNYLQGQQHESMCKHWMQRRSI